MSNHAHRYGTTPVASRYAQPFVARRLNTETAPKASNSRTRPDRPEKGQGEPVNNLNSILLEGNLSREPELRYTPQGTPICTLVVASNRSYKADGERVEEVSFIESLTTGKLASVCAEHLSKSRGVRVVGRIKQERWEDAAGNARSKVVIVAEHVEFQPQRTPQRERETAAAAS